MKGIPISGPIRDDSPCIDCKSPERHYACHDTCKRKAEWDAKIEMVKQRRREYLAKNELGWRKK